MKNGYFVPKSLLLLVLALIQIQIIAQTSKGETINVFQTGSPIIDGKIDEKEWQDGVKYDLSGGGKAIFKYDGSYLYVAVRGLKAGWSHLYLSEGGEMGDIAVHHASAALGKIIYKQDKNKVWQPLNAFSWELRERAMTEETRRKMTDYLSKNYWAANNNNMGNPTEIEFQLKPKLLSNNEMRLALVYAADPHDPQFFPESLKDDCLKSDLVAGNAVQNLKFDVSQWAKISLVDAVGKDKKTDDLKEASEVPDKLFAAMREKNAEAIAALFIAEGQLVAIDKPRSGQGISTRRVFTGTGFAKAIAEGKGDYIEKMTSKEIKIEGDLAIVYGRYTFHVGETFSHCGINSFHLVRTENGWKIANAASTLEFKCEENSKGKN